MPAFATLLLHLDGSARTGLRTRLARELAESFGARVRGQYGVTPSLLRYPLALEGAGAAADAMARYDDECRERARLAFEEARAGAAAMVWSEVRTQGVADLAREALYADLLVLGQHNAAAPEAAETPADLVPQLLLESGRPALVIPWAGPVDSVGRRVLVAWKPAREAARAVSASLPWLRGADRVAVACDAAVRPDILGFLRGHGVEADAVPAGDDDAAAGEWLLSSAADFGADLLVMGAYGHARLREWIVGGATRTVLQSMTLPVLMAH